MATNKSTKLGVEARIEISTSSQQMNKTKETEE